MRDLLLLNLFVLEKGSYNDDSSLVVFFFLSVAALGFLEDFFFLVLVKFGTGDRDVRR